MEIHEISTDRPWRFDGQLWGKVHVDPWWSTHHRHVDYWNEPFNDAHQEKAWRTMGFDQKYFTGDLYDMRAPKPNWIDKFDSLIDLEFLSWCLYKMQPGRILPNHSDTYGKFKEIYSLTNDDFIVRLIFFLEDWQSGHYFEIESTAISHWCAGDGIYWAGAAKHIAGNLGHTPRYTVQFTGVYRGL